MRALVLFASLWLFSFPCSFQQSQPSVDTQSLFARTKAATVIVLGGQGAGRLHSLATGVVISSEGTILTALHAVKGEAEVQIRLPSGDVFDHVQMLGSDERRDVVALKIAASGLSALSMGNSSTLVQGDPVYAVTNAGGLTWSATEGIVSAIRPAEEITGAGSGYRVLQFTDPVAPGSSGGALVDRTGVLVGIITSGKGTASFAIPIEAVSGLPAAGEHVQLGSGALLQLPSQAASGSPLSSAAIANTNPNEILKDAKTIYVQSKTSFLTVDTLDRALALQKDWNNLGLTLVQDPRVADLTIEVDRPLFTYVHTFVIVDKRTSIILGSGKVTAFDGTIASGGLAKDIVDIFKKQRLPTASK